MPRLKRPPNARRLAAKLASLSPVQREAALDEIPESELGQIFWDWEFWARPNQLAPPGDWLFWLRMAGRGEGKTRSGAEWIIAQTKTTKSLAAVGPTAADVRDVMLEGESGILACSPPWWRPHHRKTANKLIFPNGSTIKMFSAEEPARLRGHNVEKAWLDEVAWWKRLQESYEAFMFGIRKGQLKVMMTTTPRPLPLLRELVDDPDTVMSRGSSYDNIANLSPLFAEKVLSRFEGTRIGRQEIYGELLDEIEGALWTMEQIHSERVALEGEAAGRNVPAFWKILHDLQMARVVVAVDPAGSVAEDASDTGIIIAGLAKNGHAYVIGDESCHLKPAGWAKKAAHAFHFFEADLVVGERNYGGDMVEATIQAVDARLPFKMVTASKSKWIRAEPISALYEQGRVHHVGILPDLEEQMCNFAPGDPVKGQRLDRLDALVWALTELFYPDAPESAYILYRGR